jgi:hypothetical protein
MYYLIPLIIAVAAIFFFWTRRKRLTHPAALPNPDQNEAVANKNPYHDLRGMALNMTAEQLGLAPDDSSVLVHGVVMDWGIRESTATVVSYCTGDASLYLSHGGGMLGGGQHPSVSDAAKRWVQLAQQFLHQAAPAAATPLPGTDRATFYLLTNKGLYCASDTMPHFEDNTSPWLPLFNSANEVLAELRQVSDSN